MKLKKGDKVKILAGKDMGKESEIERVIRDQGKVLVKGVNVVKKHVKPSEQFKEGGIIDMAKPVDVSNLMFVCPKCSQAVRLGIKRTDKKKVRVCRRCKAEV